MYIAFSLIIDDVFFFIVFVFFLKLKAKKITHPPMNSYNKTKKKATKLDFGINKMQYTDSTGRFSLYTKDELCFYLSPFHSKQLSLCVVHQFLFVIAHFRRVVVRNDHVSLVFLSIRRSLFEFSEFDP